MKHLEKDRLLKIIKSFAGQKILVLGDIMLDRYQYGVVERISPEAPVPVVKILEEEYRLGGAANVANNIKELGGEVFLIGSCGKDRFEDILKDLLLKRGMEFKLFEKKITTLKTRIIAKGQQILRIDRENTEEEDINIETINDVIKSFEVIVISDYAKGFISKALLKEVSTHKDKLVLIDPKYRNFFNYKNSYLITPNKKEASSWCGREVKTDKDLIGSAKFIMDCTGSKNLIITLGKDGMAVFLENSSGWKLGTVAHNVFDVTGAGDVVISILALALKGGATLPEAAFLSNLGAGISVEKLGTSVVSSKELMEELEKRFSYINIEKIL